MPEASAYANSTCSIRVAITLALACTRFLGAGERPFARSAGQTAIAGWRSARHDRAWRSPRHDEYSGQNQGCASLDNVPKPTYIHNVHIHTYIHTYIHAYIHTYIHTYMHTYIHSYIHTYIHTYIYIYIYIPYIYGARLDQPLGRPPPLVGHPKFEPPPSPHPSPHRFFGPF